MMQKVSSLSMAAVTLSVYLWSQLHPSDALFLFISSSLLLNLAFISLAAGLVRLSFKGSFKTGWGYALTAGGAVGFLLIGAAGILSSGFDYQVYEIFGPLDFLLLAEAGVIMATCCLTYSHQRFNLPKPVIKVPRLPLKPSLVMPKLGRPLPKDPAFIVSTHHLG